MMDMDTCQIEITNVCPNRCSNCTRFVRYGNSYFMGFDQFKEAVDSMKWYPKMTGIQGGEPLLHPDFEKICAYALKKIGRRRLGLWTTLPEGYEKYREIICATFGSIFINDHSRADIYHHPFLVAAEEVIEDKDEMYSKINHCSFQESWSASINTNGAYFCEIAASMSLLFPEYKTGENFAWPVTPRWWRKNPWDFKFQIQEFCRHCGGSLNLKRRSSSCTGGVDDISPKNLERLGNIDKSKYRIHDLKEVQECEMQELAAYKDIKFRTRIAARYGIFLTLNPLNFNEPHLTAGVSGRVPLLEQFREKYGG
jgi:hypothetical protein